MKIAFFTALATAVIVANPSNAAPQPDVTGFWESDDSDGHPNAWFYFVETFQVYEGRIVKMFPKPGAPNVPNCLKCTGDQANAPMLGLVLVKQMKRDGLKYDDGTILDPRNGKVYNAQMEISPDGQQLSVRGYLGVSLLGQTQVWTRLPDDSIARKDIPRESQSPHLKGPPPPD
jgi:uncharacterized protein (DUF2147 family)